MKPDTQITGAGAPPGQDFQACIRVWLAEWAELWRDPLLADETRVEFSSRMTRTLGRAYPARMLIRLSASLTAELDAQAFKEFLCHEAAHLVAFRRHGRAINPHGPEWRRLVEAAGYRPTTKIRMKDAEPARSTGNRVRYLHSCPVCGTRRTAGKPMYRWRCVTCVDAGLDGRLLITNRPRRQESTE